jgi:transcriptional antiterminator NusG
LFFLIKTTPGRERAVAESIMYKAVAEKIPVLSLISPDDLRGYMIVECQTSYPVDLVIQDVKNARGRLPGVLSAEEVNKYFGEKPVIEALSVGDLVEVKSGVFKRMKAKILEMDTTRNEITIELQEGATPFPITLSADLVKYLGKSKEGEESGK